MDEYQVIARRYRPKQFRDVIGQEAVVRTLSNAICHNKLAHAYLFSGSRGTGKTTLARLIAKSLNCPHRAENSPEPCSSCPTCVEIASGSSIDVLEIDGASHRGIDDIRMITESAGYSPSHGKYKVYIVDEVHMLTKEAFNALLKTLEEPPKQVIFIFATTEPHKIPATIISRCQRFNLKRIPLPQIVQKLTFITKELSANIEQEALLRIAEYAEGGLRDAESLLDQILACATDQITADLVGDILGVMPKRWFLEFDAAFASSNFAKAFTIADEVFLQGKDIGYFIEDLANHFCNLLRAKVAPDLLQHLDPIYQQGVMHTASAYTKEQLIDCIDYTLTASMQLKSAPSQQLALEALFVKILREKERIVPEALFNRLEALGKEMQNAPIRPVERPIVETVSPRAEILPSLEKKEAPPLSQKGPEQLMEPTQNGSRHDTIMQFAAVELGGTVKR